MVIAKLRVTQTHVLPIPKMIITAGLVGAEIEVDFYDTIWEGLAKTVVFQGGRRCVKDVLVSDDTNVVSVPSEVLDVPGVPLRVGVYGVNADETVVVPTIWADLGRVHCAADPSGDTSTDPTLPVWAQLQSDVEKLKRQCGGGSGGGLYIESDEVGNVIIESVGSTTEIISD